MTHFKKLCLIGYLTLSSLAFGPQSFANAPQDSAKPAATMEQVRATLKKHNFENMMDMFDAVAAKLPGHDGPTHLHPKVKFVLRKTYLPHYFDSLDSLHHGKTAPVKANFTTGKGDQSQTVKPLDVTNAFLFSSTSKIGPDEPISEEIWGRLTSRQLFEALEFPKVEQLSVKIRHTAARSNQLETDVSLSGNHLSVQAKDASGLWVYSLDMPINSNTHNLKFTTKDYTEIYTLDGMSTDAVQSIKINNKTVFTKADTRKISEKLREELSL